MPKKVEKKTEPDPAESRKSSTSESTPSTEPMFKLPKKKVSVKQLPKDEPKEEESPFGKIKLKKAETVKRTWEDEGLEKVDLKHHEFERAPQEEEVHTFTVFTLKFNRMFRFIYCYTFPATLFL